MEVGQRCIIKFFMEKGMKRVEITDSLNKLYIWDELRRAQVYYWTKEVNARRKSLSNI
jgi:hypothetical protein